MSRVRKTVIIDPDRIKYKGMKPLPQWEPDQNKMGDKLVDWAFKEGLEIEDFPLKEGYNPTRFYRLAHRNTYFADCLQLAKYVLGSKIKHGVRQGELDLGYLKEMLPGYNPEYYQFVQDRIQRHMSEITKTQYVIKEVSVELDKIPNSSLVPEQQQLLDNYEPVIIIKELNDKS